MDLVVLIAVGVVIGVVGLSGVLFLAFRKREEAFTTISQQAEAIEATGKKKRPQKGPYRPWANRPKKGNTPQGSPKVDRSEKAPEQASSDPPSLPKDEPPRKKAPSSATAPVDQGKNKEPGKDEDQEKKKQGAAETKQSPAKREQVQEKKEGDRPAPPLQDPRPVPKEAKKQSLRAEEPDVAPSSKPKAKPKASGKRGSFTQVRELLENTAMQEDEIHVLIEVLLAKREDSEAWQEAGGKVANNQQLRRQLDDMTAKYNDAMQSADVLSASVKKLRGELNTEASRRQQQEATSQAQIGRLSKDIQHLRQRLSTAQEELEKTRKEAQHQQQPQEAVASGENLVLQGMQEEIARLQASLTESNQEKCQFESKVKSLSASLQESHAREKELSATKAEAQSQASATQLEANRLNGLLAAKEKDMMEQVERLQKELDQSREDQERLNSDVTALQFDKQSLETQLLKAEQSVSAASTSQEVRACQAEAQSAELKEERDRLLAQQDSKEKDLHEFIDARQKLQDALDAKEKERANLADQVLQLEKQLEVAKAASTSPDVAVIKELEDCNKQLAAEAAHAKEQLSQLQAELKQREEAPAQQVQDQLDGSMVHRELHQQQLACKEEELEKLSEKLEALKKEKTSLEHRVTDLKQKNSDLYNKSWKATDEAEKAERRAQQEICIAQRKAEERVVAAVQEQTAKEQERTKGILHDLLPDIEVGDAKEYEEWLEAFVQEAGKSFSVTNGPSTPSPDSSVADLEAALKEKEASEVELKQNVSQLTDTLQRTSESLVSLQS